MAERMKKSDWLGELSAWIRMNVADDTDRLDFFRYGTLYFDWHSINNEPIPEDFPGVYARFERSTLHHRTPRRLRAVD